MTGVGGGWGLLLLRGPGSELLWVGELAGDHALDHLVHVDERDGAVDLHGRRLRGKAKHEHRAGIEAIAGDARIFGTPVRTGPPEIDAPGVVGRDDDRGLAGERRGLDGVDQLTE